MLWHRNITRQLCAFVTCAFCLLLVAAPLRAQAAGLGAAHLEIVAVDSSRQPGITVTVQVRDASGHGINGLQADAFSVEEQGRTIPGEQLQLAPSEAASGALSLAIVADTSALLGPQAIDDIRADARTLLEQVASQPDSVALGLYVPRSATNTADQRIEALPFTTDRAAALSAIAALTQRSGQTDLYNVVVAAINASADAAAQRGGPAYVAVFSDGLDRTSIVGAGEAGANEAARIAETRRVRVLTFGYGAALKRGSPLLTQLADRAGGSYQANPAPESIGQLAGELRRAASGGTYTLHFDSALPTDGGEHPLTVRLRLTDQTLDAQTSVLIPRPWDSATPLRSNLQIDAQQYPTLQLTTRPINQLRRTVPNLTAADLQLTLDGKPITPTLTLASEPLDARAAAAAQSVAVVVDQRGPNATALREQATTFLQTPDDIPSRIALFVPGVATGAPEFTHDHNANINALNATTLAGPGGELGTTLLQAIDAAARDGDAAQRPAYVVLFADQPLPVSQQGRAATLARNLGVTIVTVAFDATADRSIAGLAEATSATHLVAPDTIALQNLAQRIQQDRASHYVITGAMPAIADGAQHTLGVTLRGTQTQAPFTALVAGEASVRPPTSPLAQALLALTLGSLLTGAAFLPRLVENRRRRCPTCKRFRRASWGDSCLFCERELASSASSHSAELPLSGFAKQGALILHTGVPAKAAPAVAQAAFAPEAGPLVDAPHPQTDFWGPVSAEGIPAEQSAAYAFEQPEANRSHTDFWGPLPQTATIQPESSQEPAANSQQPAATTSPTLQHRGQEPAATHAPIHVPLAEEATSNDTGFWGPIEPK